jgi:hypothetical protein
LKIISITQSSSSGLLTVLKKLKKARPFVREVYETSI